MRDIPHQLIDPLETLLNEPVKATTDARILELRKKFRRAYAPWTPEEDILLLQLHESGFDVPELKATFCRQGGAIRSRLDKLIGDRAAAVALRPVPTLTVTAHAEQVNSQFGLWLEAVQKGGQVDIMQGGVLVARLVKP